MEVYREILPESYLLILVDEVPPTTDSRKALSQALSRAARSGKASIWLDCSNLHQLPGQAPELLHHYCAKLRRRGISLLLCHLSEAVGRELLAQQPGISAFMVPTLLDAQQYCRQRVNRPWPVQRLAS